MHKNIFKNKKILVVVAHPDDELLGLGATMHKLIREYNCQIRTLILEEGITSRSKERDPNLWKDELNKHRRNIEQARKVIGYDSTSIYNFPDNRFDTIALLDIVKVVEKEKDLFKPEIIFTHHAGDLNIDHQRTFEAVMTATRPMDKEKVNTILTFETPSSTEWIANSEPRRFIPNLFFEVSVKDLEAKINGMESYEFEKRKYPHPRSPKALLNRAVYWGVGVGLNYAEPFQLIRYISKNEQK